MKYFRFALVDSTTKISVKKEESVNGKMMPDLPIVKFFTQEQDQDFWLVAVKDSAVANPDNDCFEITKQELAERLQVIVNQRINSLKPYAYQDEKNLRSSLFEKYHDTASIAGIYKYEQSKQLFVDETAEAPDVRAEAQLRGVDPVTLAERIIQNHEDFRHKESKIAGIRGKVIDRLVSYVFDMDDPEASWNEFISEEVIGQKTIIKPGPTGPVEEVVDVTIGKYQVDLGKRYEYAQT
jgi:hypothetical protein